MRQDEIRLQLIKRVETVFASIKRPKVMLHPNCMDDMDIEAFYPFEAWQSIPGELLAHENMGLNPASAEGFQFLLPAYMHFCLKQPNNFENLDPLLFAFQPDKGLFEFQVSKYAVLTKAQKQVILEFLRFMSQEPEGEDALEAKTCMEILWSEELKKES